jgi:hypothetical protein
MKQNVFAACVLTLATLTPSPAFATGSLGCEVDDANLRFSANSPVGRGMGGPIINMQASVEIKLKDVPADLAKVDLSKSLVHSWLDSGDVRLHFYSERSSDKPHGYVELVIKTVVAGDEGTADGDYSLTVFEAEPAAGKTESLSLMATGKISCDVE